jgi:DNA uptake protein ComE-like DNA-binding protein
MKTNKFWELFVFTQKEKRGILILVFILLIAIVFEILLPYLFRPSPIDFTEWEKEIDHYLAAQPQVPTGKNIFNPNEVDSLQLIAMGIPSSIASHWIHYLQKGGLFKTKEDLKKIYGMTSGLYKQLEPFLSIPEEKKTSLKLVIGSEPYTRKNIAAAQTIMTSSNRKQLDLNEADSIALEKLPGIGPVLASRIIRFRKILGGYYSVDQLRDVYGLRPEHFLAASPFLLVEEKNYRKINLNFASFSEIVHHPYIGYKSAIKITRWKDQRGRINSIDELNAVMGEDSLKKLSPYLVFD